MPPLPEKIEKKYFEITKSLTNISKLELSLNVINTPAILL